MRPPWTFILTLVVLLACRPTPAQTSAKQTDDDFASKSIEELMNVPVSSVSRKDQKLSKTPAAVYVITEEAIQRSGATIIPDLLRSVPGVQVAEVESNRWAISVRGFNGVYSNKLLVLVDGRTVYTPTTSGVYWDQLLAIPLDTIERIEVVRGPGGAVWGINAVNGVINIMTKHTKETQGTQIIAGAGSSQTSSLQTRYGGSAGQWGTYRVFGQYGSSANRPAAFSGSHDSLHFASGGFRLDSNPAFSSKDSFYAEGNFAQINGVEAIAQTPGNLVNVSQPMPDQSFDVTAHWTHNHSDNSQSSLQIYDNHYNRVDLQREHSNTIDIDFQNHTKLGSRNDLVWGGNYRSTQASIRTEAPTANQLAQLGYVSLFDPEKQTYTFYGGFFQDEFAITNSLSLTAGTKLEHNAFSGFGNEPTVRLAWTPTASSTVWAAASEVLRQPSALNRSLEIVIAPIPLSAGYFVNSTLSGSKQFRPESARDFEVGYRALVNDRVSVDAAGFYSLYSSLTSAYAAMPSLAVKPDGFHLQVPLSFANGASGRNYGAEISSNWNATSRWKLTGNYTWARSTVRNAQDFSQLASFPSYVLPIAEGVAEAVIYSAGAAAPQSQVSVQSFVDLNKHLAFDNSVYFVGRLSIGVPAYTRLDSRLSYRFNRHLEARLVGQNLVSPRHVEFANFSQVAVTYVPRNIFGELRWNF